MTRRTQRRGYVLLITLGLIGLVGIALAGLARYSLRLALDSRVALEDAQQRWGEISCRRILLDRADEILDAEVPVDAATAPRWPRPSRFTVSFVLGEEQFNVLLSDESAKVNLNAVLRTKPAKAAQMVRDICDEWDSTPPRIQLRPQQADPKADPRVESWGQVFDLPGFEPAGAVPAALAAATMEMSCWGDGRLNLRRASDDALRRVAGLVLDGRELAKLVEARQTWQATSMDDMLRTLSLRRGKYVALRRLLSDESDCFSLWLDVETNEHPPVDADDCR